jgi:hypothetical protein
MVSVTFLPNELRSLDRFRAQLLVLTIFEDERPLRGLGGLVDWRTCGMLSRFLIRGHVTGSAGEVVLFPTGRRLPAPRGLIFGLGPTGPFDERAFRDVAERIAQHAERLGARSLALSLPGLHRKALDPVRAVGLFADAAGDAFAQLTIFAPAAERRDLIEVLRRRRGEYEVASAGSASS